MTPWGLLTKGKKTRKKIISKKVIFKRLPRRIDCLIKVKHYKQKFSNTVESNKK